MGRYESQRAIAARTISHRRRGRKRSAWGWSAARRLSALAVTIGAILTASWFGPRLRRPPAEPPRAAQVELFKNPPTAEVILPPAAANEPPRTIRRRRVPRDTAPPAAARDPLDGLEVLSAGELDSISQAR